jgi:hypothetical protein
MNNPKRAPICVEDLVASFYLFCSFQTDVLSSEVSCHLHVVAFTFLSFLVSTSACVCIPSYRILTRFRIYYFTTSPCHRILAIFSLRGWYDVPRTRCNFAVLAKVLVGKKT